MPKRVTIKNIAEEAELSESTVSRVLSGKGPEFKISEATQKKVAEIAERLGYYPNALSRAVRLNEPAKMVGVIVPAIHNLFYSAMVQSVEESISPFGFSILLGSSREDVEREVKLVRLMRTRIVSAMIICPVGFEVDHINEAFRDGLPTVAMDRYDEKLKCPFVGAGNEQGAYEMAKYLIGCNHRRIAAVPALNPLAITRERMDGFARAHGEAGIEIDERLLTGREYSKSEARAEANLLLSMDDPPTAIFALNNNVAMGVLEHISRTNKLKIPDDVSVVGFDDEFYMPYLSTPMTTVSQNCRDMGMIAAKILMEQWEESGTTEGKKIVLPTELKIRGSVKTMEPRAKS